MTHRPDADNFLRTAVKAGLRLQRDDAPEKVPGTPGAGMRTLIRIKASMKKRTQKGKPACET